MADEPLIPGVDYYLEEERWVFTAHFLKKRGYCCESGCRHCPYGFGQQASGERDKEEPIEE